MTFRKIITAIFSSAAVLALILDSKTALAGASSGIALCTKAILPSLFPFLFLCAVLTNALWGQKFALLRLLGRRTGVPSGAESILIAAALGGYPAGAQAVAAAYADGKLTRQNAEDLLCFCNNAGPAFLFGIVSSQFEENSTVWALFIIHLMAAFLTGALRPISASTPTQLHSGSSTVPELLTRSVKAVALVCGWIILFRILTEYLSHWFFHFLPELLQVIICGVLELSNGCCNLSTIQNASVRFLTCSCMLSIGGVCITMQTASVIGTLSIKPYLRGKLLHTIFSLILSVFYLYFGWFSLFIAAVFILVVPKKTVDFHYSRMYNKAKIHERNQIHAVS